MSAESWSELLYGVAYLFDDVSYVQQPLLVDHPTMENAGYNQLSTLDLECHTLKH